MLRRTRTRTTQPCLRSYTDVIRLTLQCELPKLAALRWGVAAADRPRERVNKLASSDAWHVRPIRHGETDDACPCNQHDWAERGRVSLAHPLGPEQSMEGFLISTGVVALAEIGDKTQLLALVLAAKYRKPVPIILGILC